MKYPGKKFEIRYAIAPLDVSPFNEKMKQEGTKMAVTPNQLYSGAYMATLMNLSGGSMPQVHQFPKQAVAKEFNADWGATTIFHVKGTFGDGYDACMAIALHKDNAGDAYIFYLSDSMENFQTLLEPAFHALKFRESN